MSFGAILTVVIDGMHDTERLESLLVKGNRSIKIFDGYEDVVEQEFTSGIPTFQPNPLRMSLLFRRRYTSLKLISIPNRLFERFDPLCAFCGQDPQFVRNRQRVFAFFSDPLIPFLQFLFGLGFACEKKALSLSVDLEPIEVIMVTAVALLGSIRNVRRAMGRHSHIFPILAAIGNRRRWIGWLRVSEKPSRQVWKPNEEGWQSGLTHRS